MRKSVKRIYGLATALTAVLLACLITGAVMACLGYQPLSAYYQLVFGSIGGKSALCESVVKATPLVLTGLSFSIAFKAGLINLGATGQVYIGALFTTLAATCIPGLPAAAMIPLALLAGAAGGIELLAIHHRLLQSFAGNIGFDGIAVALLGGNHPAGILSAALLFGMLSNGSNKMQMLSNVPNAVVYLLQGLIVLFVVGSNLYTKEFWQPYLRAWKRKRKEAE